MARKRKRKSRDQRDPTTSPAQKTLRVTYPNGRVETIPDDGRPLPKGTMVSWDETTQRGHKEMRWTVIGGGWPFDD